MTIRRVRLTVCIVIIAFCTLVATLAALLVGLCGAVAAAATHTVSIESGALVAFAMLPLWTFCLKLAKASLEVFIETRKEPKP